MIRASPAGPCRTCCCCPGIGWLLLFYVYPAIQMFLVSLWTGQHQRGLQHDLELRHLRRGALASTGRGSSGRPRTAGSRRSSPSSSGIPLAYTIAFRGGAYKNLLLFLVIAPFFTSFLLRTISWKIILSTTGSLLGPLKDVGLLPDDFRVLATPTAVIAGITYNFLPFMTLPLYVALEKVDRRLLEAAKDLYAGPWRPRRHDRRRARRRRRSRRSRRSVMGGDAARPGHRRRARRRRSSATS